MEQTYLPIDVVNKLVEYSIKRSKFKLSKSRYLAEHAANSGLRMIYENQSTELTYLIYAAEEYLKAQAAMKEQEVKKARKWRWFSWKK